MKIAKKYDDEMWKLNIAAKHSGLYYWDYDVVTGVAVMDEFAVRDFGMPRIIEHFPEDFINLGFVHKNSRADYVQLTRDMKAGVPFTEKRIRMSSKMQNKWYIIRYTCCKDAHGVPVHAFATAQNIDQICELEERFTTVAAELGLYTWIYDLKYDYAKQSPSMIDILGNFQSRIPESMFEVGSVHPDDIEAYRKFYEKLHTCKTKLSINVRRRNIKTGRWNWYRVRYTMSCDSNNVPVRALGFAVNIDHQKELEENFRTFQNYKLLLSENTIGYISINLTQNTLGEGDSKDTFLKQLRNCVTADDYFDVIYERCAFNKDVYTRTITRENLLKAFEEGRHSVTIVYRFLMENEPVWLRTTIHMVENPESGDIEAFICSVNIDHEKLLSESMDKIMEDEYEFLFTIHLQSHKAKSLCLSKKIENLIPYQELPYEQLLELMSHGIRTEHLDTFLHKLSFNHIEEELKKNNQYIYKLLYQQNGKDTYKQWKFYYADDQHDTCLFVQADITEEYEEEIKRQKELTAALEQAKSANNAKMDFLSHVSHDMRTPMNGILGLVELSKMQELPDFMVDNLKKIEESGKYLLNLINETLDMSRIESNKVVFNYDIISAEVYLDSIVSMIRPLAAAKNINFIVTMENVQLVPVRIDKIHVKQILINVLTNAIKFTPEGGNVDFKLQCIKRTETSAKMLYTISDTGIGMSKEFLPKMFDAFEQEYHPELINQSGTGLGMSIVKNLVELMGGSIEVQSELGVGTTVKVCMDVERCTDYSGIQNKTEDDTIIGKLKGKHLLLVEDQPLNVEIAKRLLQAQGAIITVANDGLEGLETLESSKKGTYQAILMDIRMPVMDGITATKRIRTCQHPDAITIPIIAMTANAFSDDVKETLEAGMNAHLAKPVDKMTMYKTIASFL